MTTLVLVGSGEFTPAMANTDRQLLAGQKHPLVAILPTAAGLEPSWQNWISDGIKHFKSLGISAIGIPVLNKSDAKSPEFINLLDNATMIYFSGGHPGHLLSVIKDSPLWTKIYALYQQGTILVGSSAGAMLMGSFVLSNAQEVFEHDKTRPLWQPGINLIPYSIIPHYDFVLKKFNEQFSQVIANAPSRVKNHWLGIDENTALIISDDAWTISSSGSIYYNGVKSK